MNVEHVPNFLSAAHRIDATACTQKTPRLRTINIIQMNCHSEAVGKRCGSALVEICAKRPEYRDNRRLYVFADRCAEATQSAQRFSRRVCVCVCTNRQNPRDFRDHAYVRSSSSHQTNAPVAQAKFTHIVIDRRCSPIGRRTRFRDITSLSVSVCVCAVWQEQMA